MALIAMDLGGTKLAAALFNDDGELQARESVPLGGRGGADVAALMVERFHALRARAAGPVALGVAVPGIYRPGRGTVWAPNIPGWDDFPLREVLEGAASPGDLVVIDSDRAASIMGEAWRGAAAGARDAICLVVGTGIGAGILAGGRVLRGSGDIAGAIGWLAMDRPFREPYVGCGCFEHHASGPGLAKVAREMLDADPAYQGELRRGDPAALTAESVFAAANRDDPVATRVIAQAIEFWAMAAANLVSLFNPEVIVFGGGLFGPAAAYLSRIREGAARWAQPIAMQQVSLVASVFGPDAPLNGAARLAMLAREEREARATAPTLVRAATASTPGTTPGTGSARTSSATTSRPELA